ncbi:DUF2306 domain-containing protein [Alteromonadaceae bacterium M269]|nr:DUF2306 domain-containing protein [Alteromonadaceae bacterium M269]
MHSQTELQKTYVETPINIKAESALKLSVSSWLVVALIGQWLFALYILTTFAFPLVGGGVGNVDFSHMITGYIEGDNSGNFAMLAHIIPAALLSMGGVIQIMPYVRKNYPAFHRWNGRLFLTLGLIGAVTGLYLTWGRGSRLSDIGAYGISLNGVLILVVSLLAWRYAMLKKFDLHKRFAVHAFILINGVWTFRLYLMSWFMINQGANGNNSTLDGPADLFFSYACYALPMLVAELYFWAKRQKSKVKKAAVSGVLWVGTLVTTLGVFGAFTLMWLPRITQVIGS